MSVPPSEQARSEPTRPPSTGPAGSAGARIVGVDLARFLALAGMMAAHVWVLDPGGDRTLIVEIVSGKAAALFAVLAGAGIVFTTHRDLAAGRFWAARRNLFGRGLVIVLIGLTLGLFPVGPLVILVFYGVLFWVSALFVRGSDRALIITAVLLAVIWPPLSSLLRAGWGDPDDVFTPSWLSLGDPLALLRALFVSGAYPVLTWAVYALVGMVAGRALLRAARSGSLRHLGVRMAAVGSVIAAAGWAVSTLLSGPAGALSRLSEASGLAEDEVRAQFFRSPHGAMPADSLWWLLSPAPHSGTLFDLAITTGIGLAVIGLCVLLGASLPPLAIRLLAPVRRAGSAPLTIYTLHVLATALPALIGLPGWGPEGVPWYLYSGQLWALHVLGAILIGDLLNTLRRRGPLETAVTAAGRLFATGFRSRAQPPL